MTDRQLALLLRYYRVELEAAITQVEKQLPQEIAGAHNRLTVGETPYYAFTILEPLNNFLERLDYDIDMLEDRQPDDEDD